MPKANPETITTAVRIRILTTVKNYFDYHLHQHKKQMDKINLGRILMDHVWHPTLLHHLTGLHTFSSDTAGRSPFLNHVSVAPILITTDFLDTYIDSYMTLRYMWDVVGFPLDNTMPFPILDNFRNAGFRTISYENEAAYTLIEPSLNPMLPLLRDKRAFILFLEDFLTRHNSIPAAISAWPPFIMLVPPTQRDNIKAGLITLHGPRKLPVHPTRVAEATPWTALLTSLKMLEVDIYKIPQQKELSVIYFK